MESSNEGVVLVTGATGFVASHVIGVLLQNNYKVRGTVRSLKDEKKYAHLKKIFSDKAHNLEFVEADLVKSAGWDEATKGCDFIMHVASPFPSRPPRNEMDLIIPAREGTLNVLRAGLKNGVKKIVLTGSMASVMYGNAAKIVNEKDWSIEAACGAYEKSKMLAERAAWEFQKQNPGKFELVVLNPGLIMGPPLSANGFTSGEIVEKVFKNDMPGIPKLSFPIVDVRDVAVAHLNALKNSNTDGKRFCLVSKVLWAEEIVGNVRVEFEKYGYKIVKRTVGKCPLHLASVFDSQIKLLLPHIGLLYRVDASASTTELGIKYRDTTATIVDMGYSLIDLGIVPKAKKYAPRL